MLRPKRDLVEPTASSDAEGPAEPGEGVEFVVVRVMGLRFLLRVGLRNQSFRWLALAAVQRAAALKRVHGRQRQREFTGSSPLQPPVVALHAGEAVAPGGGRADTTHSFCCNPPPNVRVVVL